jgi:4-amino-4-deoxy-L-arabinose transferase-like glycosyltransferase
MYSLMVGLETQTVPGGFTWPGRCWRWLRLTKGLIAPVFFFAAVFPLLLLSGQWRRWRSLKPVSGFLLYLLIAAPWHILAGLRNPDQGHPVGNIPTIGNVHGFWYFYFLNEHVFRFLGLALSA